MQLDLIRTSGGGSGDRQGPAAAFDIGRRVRSLRTQRGWTLETASEKCDLSRSALSKIERNEASPTFAALQKIASGLGMELVELLGGGTNESPVGRRSLIRAGESQPQQIPNYQLRVLVKDLKHTAFLPYETRVEARDIGEFEDWSRHDSEDFVYVVSGVALFYSEHYEPVELGVGDSLYFDGRMGHAFVSVSEENAVMLCISAFRE